VVSGESFPRVQRLTNHHTAPLPSARFLRESSTFT
jgi:hypothetical protein